MFTRYAKTATVLWFAMVGCSAETPTGNAAVKDAAQSEYSGLVESRLSSSWRFSTYCQEDFEGDWLDTLYGTWNRCGWFNDEMNDAITQSQYLNLANDKWLFERNTDWNSGGQGIDEVEFAFMNTHGGADANNAFLAMWNSDTHVFSNDMYLGNNNLAVLTTYACKTLKNGDGKLWTRLYPPFSGGLRLWVGSHSTVYNGPTTDEAGEDYAENLRNGKTFKKAWRDALADWGTENDPAIVATGATAAECQTRKDTMNLDNIFNFARRGDTPPAAPFNFMCWSTWDNL